MKFWKKIAALLFILCIPVSIILFLNFFGDSQYEVPVFYSEGVDRNISGCLFDRGSHTVPSFVLHQESGGAVSDTLLLSSLNVINYMDGKTSSNTLRQVRYQIERTFESLSPGHGRPSGFKFITLSPELGEVSVLSESHGKAGEGEYYLSHSDPQYMGRLMKCGLVISDSLPLDEQFVLVDTVKRIRGYYHVLNPDEMDRLIVEMKIILEN